MSSMEIIIVFLINITLGLAVEKVFINFIGLHINW